MLDYKTLYEVGKLLAAETDILKVLQLSMDKAISSAKAERGMILVKGENGSIQFETARNIRKRDIARPEFEVSRTIINKVLKSAKPVVLNDALNSQLFHKSKSVKALQILSVACVAFKAGEDVIGAIYLDNRKLANVFTRDTERFLVEFAALITVVVQNALEHRRLRERGRSLRLALADAQGYGRIVSKSHVMSQILRLVDEIADTDARVIIYGETGTGKELIARALHEKSGRCQNEFVALNCAGFQENLLESELFGHVRGAFTGAYEQRTGWLKAAHGGTLFLDEIAELMPRIQAKLLRFLQSGEYSPLGSTVSKKADVRILAATNHNLQDMVTDGKFRRDLYYRLNTMELTIPALRNRKEDILEIAEYLLRRHARRANRNDLQFSRNAKRFLETYGYPGNVRELENIVQKGVLLSRGQTVDASHLAANQPSAQPETTGGSVRFAEAKRAILERFEGEFIRARLQETGGNISRAARNAGMYKANFIQKMKKYELTRSMFVEY